MIVYRSFSCDSRKSLGAKITFPKQSKEAQPTYPHHSHAGCEEGVLARHRSSRTLYVLLPDQTTASALPHRSGGEVRPSWSKDRCVFIGPPNILDGADGRCSNGSGRSRSPQSRRIAWRIRNVHRKRPGWRPRHASHPRLAG
jgi:hypothetical protein